MPDSRRAAPTDFPAAGRALAAAFADDPVWSWLGTPRAWSRHAPRWFETVARQQQRGHGEVLVDGDGHGAAIWASPGHWETKPADVLRMTPIAARMFGTGLVRALRTLSYMEKHHPAEPHWYLSLLGTMPAAQGKGIGSTLVTEITRRCDEDGVPAYLESSKESNIAFYARHGFELRGQIDLPGGPPVWPMWRDPRLPSAV